MAKYKRLVVLGCSHTVGQWLPGWRDWWTTENGNLHFHQTYSEHSWPNVLAKKLGIKEVYNLASGGNSNHEIMCRTLGFEFRSDDLCVICWSYAGRECIYQEAGGIARTMDLLDKLKDTRFYEVHSQFDLEMKSREYVHQTKMHLDNIGIKYRMCKVEDWNSWTAFWPFYDDHAFMKFDIIDFALDNNHPGVESHRSLAEKLYDTLK
jgi:hypothetical protein